MSKYQSILSAAMTLDLKERLLLIEELIASIPDDKIVFIDEWLKELHRRHMMSIQEKQRRFQLMMLLLESKKN
jgi:hypothetical protein